MGAKPGKALAPDGFQKAAREKSLKYRERRHEKNQRKDYGIDSDQAEERDRTSDRSKKYTPDDDFSL